VSKFIDKLARAAAKNLNGAREDWAEHLVRAILQAARMPSEGMLEAGTVQVEICTDHWSATGACIPEHVWKTMIDAALQADRASA